MRAAAKAAVVAQRKPLRRFFIERALDTTGVSGTGRVAEGVIFSDGTVAMRWLGERKSTVFHESVDNVAAIHLHGGTSRLVLIDEGAPSEESP